MSKPVIIPEQFGASLLKYVVSNIVGTFISITLIYAFLQPYLAQNIWFIFALLWLIVTLGTAVSQVMLFLLMRQTTVTFVSAKKTGSWFLKWSIGHVLASFLSAVFIYAILQPAVGPSLWQTVLILWMIVGFGQLIGPSAVYALNYVSRM